MVFLLYGMKILSLSSFLLGFGKKKPCGGTSIITGGVHDHFLFLVGGGARTIVAT
jgi:hypothetical protein